MTPLRNIKVLDFSKVLAGPLCAQHLGELGADVIKVEPPGVGDDTRSWLPQDEGQSAIFLSMNHNKRSVALDLKSPEGVAIAHRLAREADVVLQGFGSGTARKLGIDYETLSALNPRLIYLEVSGYGRDGPLGKEPGYDVMLQAFSGMISTMGEPGGPMARASFSPVDISTGMNGVIGILAALLERERTGKGAYVEVSLLDSSIALMTYLAQSYWRTGVPPRRMGTGHPALCPYQAFDVADGHIMLGVGNDAQWRRFCAVAGLEHVVDDPRFAVNAQRVANREETVVLVNDVMKTRPLAQWLEALRGAGVPCSPIHTLDEALAHPQLEARQLVVRSEHPVLGELRNIGMPVRFNGEPRRARSAPPLLGEHTTEVLREAGLDEAEIRRLVEAGVLGLADDAGASS